MASLGASPTRTDSCKKGKVWALDKELDEPISEAGKLQRMQSEKVSCISKCIFTP